MKPGCQAKKISRWFEREENAKKKRFSPWKEEGAISSTPCVFKGKRRVGLSVSSWKVSTSNSAIEKAGKGGRMKEKLGKF